MKEQIKLAIFDLDGTLTNSQKELTTRTHLAIIKLQQRGVKVVLASGRPTYGIVPLANELELSRYGGYILSYNGAQIIDCASMQIVYSSLLPAELIPNIYNRSKEFNCNLISYDNRFIITESANDRYVEHEAFLNKMEIREVDSLLDAIDALPAPPTKCLAVADPDNTIALERELKSIFPPEQLSIYRSEPFFLEIVPTGIDKAASLERLNQHLGTTAEQMIAFGDGFNDLSMIEYAGCGVAMKNAQQPVKDVAQFVTASNDDDGVALFIEENLI